MATQSFVYIFSNGIWTPVATFQQVQGSTTVQIQQSTLVDGTSGTPATVDANGIHVYPSIGAPNASGPITATNIAANNGTATLTSTVAVTSGKTGTLQHAVLSGTQLMEWTIQTVNNAGTPTNVLTLYTNPNETYDYGAVMHNEISTVLASSSQCVFQVVATNLSTNGNQTANAAANFFWAEN